MHHRRPTAHRIVDCSRSAQTLMVQWIIWPLFCFCRLVSFTNAIVVGCCLEFQFELHDIGCTFVVANAKRCQLRQLADQVISIDSLIWWFVCDCLIDLNCLAIYPYHGDFFAGLILVTKKKEIIYCFSWFVCLLCFSDRWRLCIARNQQAVAIGFCFCLLFFALFLQKLFEIAMRRVELRPNRRRHRTTLIHHCHRKFVESKKEKRIH